MNYIQTLVSCLVLIVLLAVDVFCVDGTKSQKPISDANVPSKLEIPSLGNQTWANTDQKYSTPWTRPGQKRDYVPITQNNNVPPTRVHPKSPTNIQSVQSSTLRSLSPGPNVLNKLSETEKSDHQTTNNIVGQNTNVKAYSSEDDELREFSELLLRKDVNNVAKYIDINYQGKTTSRSQIDEAQQPLLTVKPEAYNISSISKLRLLYNNYILETNVNEHITAQERNEENDLLDDILTTPVMQQTRNFLIQKGKISKDPKDFKSLLKQIWFNMYSRGKGKIGSSGFEHVFLTEIKNTDVSGLHNWIYFYDQEKTGHANYLGYMRKLEFGDKGAILKFHFKFNNLDKPVGSMFIGTSPELEIALYTTCFLLRPNQVCPLKLGGQKFIIRTYTFRYRSKDMIGSAFPEI